MTSLKEEMRQKFEKRSSMAFYENYSGFEEGLVEKIMNLAYANLSPFSTKQWGITAVKSPVLLQRLYKAANDKRIIESAMSLIICENLEESPENNTVFSNAEAARYELELLALSIGYAAKYYCIDYFMIKVFDRDLISREIALNRQLAPAAIICLGYFKDPSMQCMPLSRNNFTNTIRFL